MRKTKKKVYHHKKYFKKKINKMSFKLLLLIIFKIKEIKKDIERSGKRSLILFTFKCFGFDLAPIFF
jgi:hypothetical protein